MCHKLTYSTGKDTMLIGYARVSTTEQNPQLQIEALKAAGCEKIFTDEGVSGSKADRPKLNAALEQCRAGDVLMVWRLDRLGRNLGHLIKAVTDLGDRGVDFRSLKEAIDTSSAAGKLIFHVMGAMAEFERDLIRDRTNAGLASAKARGKLGGRKKKLLAADLKMGLALAKDPSLTVMEICEKLGCSRSTFYREIAPKVKGV
jgi:DNA invertase Pin-like site-specific DNA recombinase